MLKFRNSNLNKLVTSLDELKDSNKKASQAQAKTFRILDEWASEFSNSAINDVTSKLTTLYSNLDVTLNEERNESIHKVTDMFNKFKEYDMKVAKHYQNMKIAEKLVKKSKNDIEKCPAHKSIRDYEIKHEKAKDDLKFAEFKSKKVNEEIDATKSILFKTEFKRMNECFIRQNEAERVILTAMSNLLEKIPDVSNEEVDDIKQIIYTKQAETNRICTRASKKLSRLSTTRINIQEMSPTKPIRPEKITPPQKPLTKFKRIKSKILGPPAVKIVEEKNKDIIKDDYRLYPCLESLNTSLTQMNLKCQPPPTYSDSESFYGSSRSGGQQGILPSAPSFNTVNEHEHLTLNASVTHEYVNDSIYEENRVERFNDQEIANIKAANNILN